MATVSNLLNIQEYSPRSFVVRGMTYPHKDALRGMNGKWNPNLKGGPGWIFGIRRRRMVEQWINVALLPESEEENEYREEKERRSGFSFKAQSRDWEEKERPSGFSFKAQSRDWEDFERHGRRGGVVISTPISFTLL